VKHLVFLTTGIRQLKKHPPKMPFFEIKGDEMHCKDAASALFNDFSSSWAEPWLSVLQCQPTSGYDDIVTSTGWKKIPSTYLLCDNTMVLPPHIQKHCAEPAGSNVEICDPGHMVMLRQPETVVDLVRRVSEGKQLMAGGLIQEERRVAMLENSACHRVIEVPLLLLTM